jgi:hypothetical protein
MPGLSWPARQPMGLGRRLEPWWDPQPGATAQWICDGQAPMPRSHMYSMCISGWVQRPRKGSWAG